MTPNLIVISSDQVLSHTALRTNNSKSVMT